MSSFAQHYPAVFASEILILMSVDGGRATLSNEGWNLSGKMLCLYWLLQTIDTDSSTGCKDRVVVVSNFTRTLDLIQVAMSTLTTCFWGAYSVPVHSVYYLFSDQYNLWLQLVCGRFVF